MNCSCNTPSVDATEKVFSKSAPRYARKFRKRGPDAAQRYIIRAVAELGGEGYEIVDIGCGIGALHLSLLELSARSARAIDISPGMIDEAHRIAASKGLAGRIIYYTGDFVGIVSSLDTCDVAMLDKVVCCYESVYDLVNHSCRITGHLYAVSYPRDIRLVRWVAMLGIHAARLLRLKFHPFWHDWKAMRNQIESNDFELVRTGHTFLWRIDIYRKVKRNGSADRSVY